MEGKILAYTLWDIDNPVLLDSEAKENRLNFTYAAFIAINHKLFEVMNRNVTCSPNLIHYVVELLQWDRT